VAYVAVAGPGDASHSVGGWDIEGIELVESPERAVQAIQRRA
jgi:hypothetical protein